MLDSNFGKLIITFFSIILFIICTKKSSFAQSNCKKLPFTTTEQPLDSLSIIPNTIELVPKIAFRFDASKNTIQFLEKTSDSISICYKVFPFVLGKKFFLHLNSHNPDSLLESLPENRQISLNLAKEELFSTPQLQKSGSLSRGISLGNRQDVFLNSALNLQLEGNITEDLYLQALLTDQNIPFQPQGNTQQIQDFDQILVRLKHKNFEISAGDIVLKNSYKNYFLKYYKNILGGVLHTNWGKDSTQVHTKIGISAAKGQFHSQNIQGVEGVQGAYRLRGSQNERFIIVLANSEKVYLDGQLLQRGFDAHYIIDYNTAEITFTHRAIITAFSRIRVDFEYATQQFARNIINFEHQQRLKNWHFATEFYREKDSPQNALTNLDSLDKINLAQSDSNIVLGSGARPEANFIAERILYTQKDTLSEGKTYQIFLRALPNSPNFWNVIFTDVGQNKGNYILGDNTANGKSYLWTAPKNGVPQGNYEPIRLLNTPNQKQMLTTSLTWKDSSTSFFLESAISEQNDNLFARNRTALNGFALKLGMDKKIIKNKQKWYYFLNAEYNSQNFRPIDRFRDVDFERDWTNENPNGRDKILQTGLSWQKERKKLSYELRFRDKEQQVNAFQHFFHVFWHIKNWHFENSFFHMDNGLKNSEWTRNRCNIYYQNTKFRLAYRYETDRNITKDSLWKSQMYFDEQQISVRWQDSLRLKFQLSYQFRQDKSPQNREIIRFSEAQNLQAQWEWRKNEQAFVLNFNYRKIYFYTQNKNEENLIARLESQVSFWKKMFRSEISIGTSTGQELRREYNFLKVSTGIGTHTWRDDNSNGIAELNEFYEALNPDERNYVKIFTPTDQYIPAFLGNFTYRLSWTVPKNLQENNWTKFIGKFQNLLSWSIQNRTTGQNIWQRFFIFLPQSNVLSEQNSFRNTLFFQKNHKKWSLEWNFRNNQQTQLLSNGMESQWTKQHDWSLRYLFHRYWTWQGKFILLNKNNLSFLENRNYFFESTENRHEIIFQRSSKFRFSQTLAFKNRVGQGQTARVEEYQSQVQYLTPLVNFNTEIRLNHIIFSGQKNTPLAYELLEALQEGRNWIWAFYWQQKLGKGLQLTFRYDGRKSENSAVVHLGRVQLNALF